LAQLLDGTLERLTAARDELSDLDAAVGDGDLGITVAEGACAVRAHLTEMNDDPVPAHVLRTAGTAFANANPSTMAALVGAALFAAAKKLGDVPTINRAEAVQIAESAAACIGTKGKSEVGDKTILDALVPSMHALRDAGEDPAATLREMVSAARSGIERTTPTVSRRGRASWVGERGAGHPDPGATAYLRLLEALTKQWQATAQSSPLGAIQEGPQ
jgi:dihydroxyacetone kinase